MTLTFAVIWSPVVQVHGSEVCFPSSYLDESYMYFLLIMFNVSLFAQWQLLLASLAYAVAVVCWPTRLYIFRSKKFMMFLIVFAWIPSAVLLPMEYLILTNSTCMNFSIRPSSYPFMCSIVIYLASYISCSIYLLLKLRQAIKERTSFTSVQTIKLVKTVRRNCVCLVTIIAITDLIPAFVFLITITTMKADEAQKVTVLIIRYICISLSYYSWITTIVTIAFTKPYRRKTMEMFGSISSSLLA
uniref:G_PROTEIN_RECEP_F1_2 domain-containing protein n=1 Tax=Steinernema glaseri TaxID=37863 RepID=A0A1I7ZR55_9BILA